jgi:peptidoglycan hydrolase-like protein with peptidoglycan-binding domain
MLPRFDGEPVEQEIAPRFKGEAVREDTSYLPPINPPKEKKPTIGERGKEVGFATGLSAAAGAIAPEILMYGVAPAAGVFAPTAPFAPAIYGAGAALRGSRLAQAGLGAIGGFTGETAGQVAEATGANPLTAEAARFAGGIIGPEFATSIRKAVSYGARKLFGLNTESAIKSVMSDIGISDKEITPSQKEFIRKQIEALRGGPSSSQAQKNIYESMAGGAQDIRSEAARRAAETTQRGASTRSALESQAEKMRLAQGKTTAIGEKALKDVQNERASIGSDREASDIGLSIREKINTIFGTQTEQRSAAYKNQEAIRDSAVAAKESVGNLVKDTPEYKVLVTDLRNKLLIGLEAQQQKTAPVTEKGVLQAYQNIYDAVTARRVQTGVNDEGNPVFKTFPTSFGALDDVRRRLGDVAFDGEVGKRYEDRMKADMGDERYAQRQINLKTRANIICKF